MYHVCLCACVYVCMYVYTYVCMYVCMFVSCMYVCMYACMYVRMYESPHTHASMHMTCYQHLALTLTNADYVLSMGMLGIHGKHMHTHTYRHAWHVFTHANCACGKSMTHFMRTIHVLTCDISYTLCNTYMCMVMLIYVIHIVQYMYSLCHTHCAIHICVWSC
jgi:hypothetical protein